MTPPPTATADPIRTLPTRAVPVRPMLGELGPAVERGPRDSWGHLVRRFAGSLSRRPLVADDLVWAEPYLTGRLAALWGSMSLADRRHSLVVARRFASRRPTATADEITAALFHDIGKTRSGLGTLGRVAATVVGPRTSRFRLYHRHEELGAELAKAAGASPATVDLIAGEGPAADDLRHADDL